MKQGLSREGLKTVACLTMLLDHIGAVLVISMIRAAEEPAGELVYLYYILRCIGRMAFPIFCFQLAEGAFHTKDPKKYALRLAAGALMAEIPFDLAFYGGLTWEHCNVMVTLLLGFGMIEGMKRVKGFWKIPVIIPFYLLANWLHTDYSGRGILLIAVFALAGEMKYPKLLMLLGMVGLVILNGDRTAQVGEVTFYLERCKLLALLPIWAYNGQRVSQSKVVQWGFYLFYPVHIAAVYLLSVILL